MEILSSAPSIKAVKTPVEFIKPSVSSAEDIKWIEEINIDQGYIELEKSFYPFKQVYLFIYFLFLKNYLSCLNFKKVKYHPFLEALEKAKSLDKLVHFIMLWGALDVRFL